MSEIDDDSTEVPMQPGGSGRTYQDEDCMEVPMQPVHESMASNVQSRVRRDEVCVLLDAAIVEGIKKKGRVVVDGHGNEDDEDMDDHTSFQYCSDDEENRTGDRVPGFGIDDEDDEGSHIISVYSSHIIEQT